MPLYLISLSNKRNWERGEFVSWLGADQVPADVFRDLRVTGGALSVWHIENDESNLDMVITALASNRDKFDAFDYGLFDQVHVSNNGIQVVSTEGITPMPNANHWHRDLIELTVDHLAQLSKSIFDVMRKDRKLSREIQAMILKAVESGDINIALMRECKMKQKIKEHLAKL